MVQVGALSRQNHLDLKCDRAAMLNTQNKDHDKLFAEPCSPFAATWQFHNMCTKGLTSHKIVNTNCSVNTVYRGKTYCFGKMSKPRPRS
jgi:hypothetical protein